MSRALLFGAAVVMFPLVSGNPAETSYSKNGAGIKPGTPRYYLGFDRNKFPGEEVLDDLRETFWYSGYWLNAPPSETANAWSGKRTLLESKGFGFLVLFRGRSYKDLKTSDDASNLGKLDAETGVRAAKEEGFPTGTVVFLDLEEGGRLLPGQRSYVHAWVDGVNGAGFRAGVYCSGMPVREAGGDVVITAQDIRDNAAQRQIVYWVYNVACPPAPGCAFPKEGPPPSESGVLFADVWQFAQSPRRSVETARCTNDYSSDGNCYAPGSGATQAVHIDVSTATSPDPSHGRGGSR